MSALLIGLKYVNLKNRHVVVPEKTLFLFLNFCKTKIWFYPKKVLLTTEGNNVKILGVDLQNANVT